MLLAQSDAIMCDDDDDDDDDDDGDDGGGGGGGGGGATCGDTGKMTFTLQHYTNSPEMTGHIHKPSRKWLKMALHIRTPSRKCLKMALHQILGFPRYHF